MLNEKQERFSQAYVLHRNATEAARTAGYATSSAHNQGYRLLQLQEVQDRVTELEQELETDVNVIEEIEKQYEFAKNNGHTNSAIKALELLSRVRGASANSNVRMDGETLETAIVGCLNVLGEEKVVQLLSKCEFSDGIFKEIREENAEESPGGGKKGDVLVDEGESPRIE